MSADDTTPLPLTPADIESVTVSADVVAAVAAVAAPASASAELVHHNNIAVGGSILAIPPTGDTTECNNTASITETGVPPLPENSIDIGNGNIGNGNIGNGNIGNIGNGTIGNNNEETIGSSNRGLGGDINISDERATNMKHDHIGTHEQVADGNINGNNMHVHNDLPNKNMNNHHPDSAPQAVPVPGPGHEVDHQHHHHQDVTMQGQSSLPIPQVDDNDTSPMVPQDPSFGFSYFAVRRGKFGLRSSVFLNWKDCEKFIDGYERAEYASFDKFEEAVTYLMSGGDQHDSDAEGLINGGMSADVGVGMGMGLGASLGGDYNSSTGAMPAKKRKMGLASPTIVGGEKDVSLVSPYGINFVGRRGVRLKAQANPNRKPTKAWDKMYQRYVDYINANGTIEVDTSKENADLLRWTRQQQHEYRYLKEAKASSMFQVKIDKLRKIGFEFKYISMEERLSTLLKYKEKYGDFNVPENHAVLGKWVDEQKKAAKKFAEEGDGTAFFDGKIKELIALGFKVDIEEAAADDKDILNQDSARAKSPDVTGKAGINPITSGGFAINTRSDDEKKWTKHYAELVEYKKENGNCEVPPSQHTPLSYWVTQQHKEYQKVQEGKASRMTLQRVQQLTDLGFVFRQVAKSFTWEQRIEQLTKYKEENGHTRVPKSDPLLGVFVNRQRYEYSKFKTNRPSTMNEARLADLEALDFVFVAGKKMDHVDFKNKKSWEQRFQELVQFRETYGHSVVPQSFPGLGEWVHSQRLYYKKLKAGKKSPLTNERLLKLADVGFVFDATKRRGNHINEIPATAKAFIPPGMESSPPFSSITPMASSTETPAAVATTAPGAVPISLHVRDSISTATREDPLKGKGDGDSTMAI